MRASLGATPAGRAFLARLPALVAAASARFGVTPGAPFTGGRAGWVAPVSDAAVLKVAFPDDESATEPDALRLLGGDGAVRLLDHAPDLGAMLIERALPGTTLLEHPDPAAAVAIACALLRRGWRPPPADHAFPTARERVAGWAAAIERCAAIPASWRAATAIRARALAAGDGPVVLGNQDFHLGNVVAAGREPWLLIDPKPVVAPPAFDSGHLVRDVIWLAPLDAAHVAAAIGQVADGLGLAPALVAGWALVRTAVNVAWAAADGLPLDADDLALGELLRGLRP